MSFLISITFILLIISFIKDIKKTVSALKLAAKKFMKISIPLIIILILVSIILYFVPGNVISKFLSNGNKYVGVLLALILGSVSLMPGFIAFPLSGILKDNGVSFMVIAAFTTSLMMVGIITFPLEKKYFGGKIALLRNIISLIIAVLVALLTGLFYGEIF